MKSFLKNNSAVIIAYLLILATAVSVVLNYDKKDIHLKLNSMVGFAPVDYFFFTITYLGDGAVAFFMLLAIMALNVRVGVYATASFLCASLTSNALKRIFFDDVNRPFFVFNYFTNHKLKLIDGVHVYIHNSFPSGHATQAFAILMCLVFVYQKPLLKWLFFAVALLTAYSRVHLSQHWLADICAGSVVGMVFSILFYFIFIHRNILESLNRPAVVLIRYWRSK